MAQKLDTLLAMTDLPFFSLLRGSRRMWVVPSLVIYPVNRCNFRCEMCDVPGIDSSKYAEMEPELMERLIDECSRLSIRPRVHFSGLGEPLLYRQMRHTIELCQEKRLPWSMTTNGYLLDSYAEALVQNHAFGINISIHGTAEKHGKITRVSNAFERTVSGLNKLDETRRRAGLKRPLVAVNCVITNENVYDLPTIYDALSQLPISSITFQNLIFSRQQLSDAADFLILDPQKLEALRNFLYWTKTNNLPVPVNIYPDIPLNRLNDYYTNPAYPGKVHCVLPWLSVRVYPTGQVGMCNAIFGDLHSQTLKEIINSPAALEMRRQVRTGEFSSLECFRCCHRSYR